MEEEISRGRERGKERQVMERTWTGQENVRGDGRAIDNDSSMFLVRLWRPWIDDYSGSL